MRITKTIKNQLTNTKPIWLMRQAGRYLPEYLEIRYSYKEFLDMCKDKKAIVEITLQPLKRFNLDAAIIFSDILLILDLIGLDINFKDGPNIKEITLEDFLYKLTIFKNFSSEKKLPIFEAICEVRQKIKVDQDLIGFAGSPWTVISYIFEQKDKKNFTTIRSLAYKKRDIFKKIIDKLSEITADYLILQLESGADLIKLFDSWAGVLPEDEFEEWVIKPTAKIVELIRKKYSQAIIIGFSKGSGLNIKKYANQTGVSALALDYTVPIEWAAENLNLPLQGNLDPVLLASDLDLSIKNAKKILDIMKERVFIFSLGHGVLPNTPVNNVKRLVDFVKEY